MKTIAIVVPVYSEAESLPIFWQKLHSVTESISCYSWSFIFINDGSKDDSFNILRNLSALDFRVSIVNFTRNFGKEAALAAGVLEAQKSNAVITIDADLQHPPELIIDLIKQWEAGSQVVVAIRQENYCQSYFRRKFSKLFSFIMSRISQTEFISGSTDFRLYDYKVVKQFSKFNERVRIFRALIDWMGYTKSYIYFDAPERFYGKSAYSKTKLFKLALDSITTFSLWPLKIIGLLGLFITTVSFGLLLAMVANYLLAEQVIYTPLAIFVVANTFLIGLVLMLIGLVAIYIGNIQTEVLGRPSYIIDDGKKLF